MRSYRGVRLVRFGEFELDVRAAELRKHGERVRLQEQPFRLLAMLVEHPGEVVLRDEIRKRLWPNDTVVEVSHGINAAVLRLREALGDSAEDPIYIETVARRGYRFKGRVAMGTAAPQQADTEDLRGQTIAHYRVIEKLGSGGMGVVYRAEDLKLGRQVALKFLPQELTGEPIAVGRFDREARAASVLSHPNICTVFAVEEHAGRPIIVMEFIEGQTLQALLANGAFSAGRVLEIAIQLAAALDAAHRKGVVHRDLKPANLMLTGSGLKVLDFGLARTSRSFEGATPGTNGEMPAMSQITQQGAILGTPHYMSPEQVQGKDAEPPSDIFSFGVVLYEMLTGRRPFDGLTTADVMAATLTSRPAPLAAGTAPQELERILSRCLAKSPEERFPASSDLKAALERVTIPKSAPAIAPTLRLQAAVTRRHLFAASGGLAVVLLVLAGARLRNNLAAPSPEITRFTLQLPGANVARLNLSPDGRQVAYAAGGRLFVRSFDAVVSRLLYEGEGTGAPFWSADGQSIAVAGGGKLRVIEAGSGSARILCDINTSVAGAWGSDGTILIGVVGDGLFRIPASGGTLTRVTNVEISRGETRHMLPQFLPGSRRFLYVAGSNRPGGNMLYAGSLDSTERTLVMPADSTVMFVPKQTGSSQGYLVFARGGSLRAQGFDSLTLAVSGQTFEIADSVLSNNAMGASLAIAHFSAAGTSLAYVSALQPSNLIPAAAIPVKGQNGITVVQNWMAGLR